MENPAIAFSIAPRLKAQLAAEAEERGVKITELIRIVLVDFVDNRSRVRNQRREVVAGQQRLPGF